LPCETSIIYENGYHDSWLDLYSLPSSNDEEKKLGNTWDPFRNALINAMLPFDDRRMRLDRMLMKQGCDSIICTDLQIFGDESIGLCLYPSDHFGLIANFKFLNEKQDDIIRHFGSEATSSSDTTGYRSMSTIVTLRVVAVGLLPLAGFLLLAL
jgi:hypothetical protein